MFLLNLQSCLLPTKLMEWSQTSPDINSIENLSSIIKRNVYREWKQNTSKKSFRKK